MDTNRAAILVSIKPEYVRAIAVGDKTVELRRKFPRLPWLCHLGYPTHHRVEDIWLVIYATLPIGAVVGMAPILEVDRRPPNELWADYKHSVGVSQSVFDQYFEGCAQGHAVRIGKYQPLTPMNMEAMRKILPGFRPPQSFRYMSSQELDLLICSTLEAQELDLLRK
jgi:predicted transcriptional regulator